MIDVSQLRAQRIGDTKGGALIALGYRDGDETRFQYGINIQGGAHFPCGALILSNDKPPRFIRSNSRCLVIAETPVFAWNTDLSALSDLSYSNPTPGMLLVARDKVLVCGQSPFGGGSYDTFAWNVEDGNPEPLSDASDWLAIRHWSIGTLGLSGKFHPLLTIGG